MVLYIYCSNESPVDVFFDNLQVVHTRGAILEETHYYPFGLTMSGISSKAAGGVKNKKKYNGIEFENDLDLNNLSAQLRDLDPQTSKWWQIDPLTENMENWSPYVSNYDNPIRYQDSKGDEPDGCCKWLLDALRDTGDQILASGAGIIGGGLNILSAGLISSDPLNMREGLRKETQGFFDGGVTAGKMGVLIASASSSSGTLPEFAPVSSGRVLPLPTITISPATPVISPVVNSSENKQGSGTGRGSNNRTRDPKAGAEHSVFDKNGNTTYEPNSKNPSGFDEVKRTDVKGKAHINSDGTKVETPHVHKKGVKDVTPAKQGVDY